MDIEDEILKDDVLNSLISGSPFESYHTVAADEIDKTHDQTTIFMNKYCEDPNLPSVANQLAEMIVDYEMSQKFQSKMWIWNDDEIVNEEEFLKIIDQELDEATMTYQENVSIDEDLSKDILSEIVIVKMFTKV